MNLHYFNTWGNNPLKSGVILSGYPTELRITARAPFLIKKKLELRSKLQRPFLISGKKTPNYKHLQLKNSATSTALVKFHVVSSVFAHIYTSCKNFKIPTIVSKFKEKLLTSLVSKCFILGLNQHCLPLLAFEHILGIPLCNEVEEPIWSNKCDVIQQEVHKVRK